MRSKSTIPQSLARLTAAQGAYQRRLAIDKDEREPGEAVKKCPIQKRPTEAFPSFRRKRLGVVENNRKAVENTERKPES